MEENKVKKYCLPAVFYENSHFYFLFDMVLLKSNSPAAIRYILLKQGSSDCRYFSKRH